MSKGRKRETVHGHKRNPFLNELEEAHKNEHHGTAFSSKINLIIMAWIGVVVPIFAVSAASGSDKDRPHTALVKISGLPHSGPRSEAPSIISAINRAMENEWSQGLIIEISSPSDSSDRPELIYDAITRCRQKHPEKPIYAILDEVNATGNYLIASAADEIYAPQTQTNALANTLRTGSISSQLENSSLRPDSLEGQGAVGDASFQDEYIQSSAFYSQHQREIEKVISSRGNRLQSSQRILSRLSWGNEQALELGLIDGLAGLGTVAAEKIGHEQVVDYTIKPNLMSRFASSLLLAPEHILANLQ